MPSTVAGLALFAALLTPGFAYLARRESRFPGRGYSTLRETAAIATASLASDVAALAALGIVRSLMPDVTPDIGRLVRDGVGYIKTDYITVAVWSVGLLALATLVAVVAAAPPRWLVAPLQMLSEFGVLRSTIGEPIRRWADGQQRPTIRFESGWTTAFQLYPESFVWLTCELTDGRVIGGWLLSANPQVEETNDRAVVLSGTLRVRDAGADEDAFTDMAVGTLVIPAGQLRFVAASYFDTDHVPPF